MLSVVSLGSGFGLTTGGVSLTADGFTRKRLLISSSPPSPAPTAATEVPPTAARNLRRSMAVLIGPSGGRWGGRAGTTRPGPDPKRPVPGPAPA